MKLEQTGSFRLGPGSRPLSGWSSKTEESSSMCGTIGRGHGSSRSLFAPRVNMCVSKQEHKQRHVVCSTVWDGAGPSAARWHEDTSPFFAVRTVQWRHRSCHSARPALHCAGFRRCSAELLTFAASKFQTLFRSSSDHFPCRGSQELGWGPWMCRWRKVKPVRKMLGCQGNFRFGSWINHHGYSCWTANRLQRRSS